MAVPSSAQTTTQVITQVISYRWMRFPPCPKSWLRAWPSKTKCPRGTLHPMGSAGHSSSKDPLPSSSSWSQSVRGAHKLRQQAGTGSGHWEPETKHASHGLPMLSGWDSPVGTQGVGCTRPGFGRASQPKAPYANTHLCSGTFYSDRKYFFLIKCFIKNFASY